VRKFPDRPLVGVGAVIVDGDRVVLVKRGHEPLKGEWSLPGGAVELAETLAEAVAREVREETGLDVEVGPVVEVLDRIHRTSEGRVEYHYVLIDYLCSCRGEKTVRGGSDAADARWVPVRELAAHGVSETAVAVIHKGLELSVRTP
jgi:ADP-ribose pyrophosphatase YjhB (NUDIX family)